MKDDAPKGPNSEHTREGDRSLEPDARNDVEPTPTNGWTTGDWFDRASSLDLSLIHISEATRPY